MRLRRDREKRAWDAAGHSNICITVARPPRGVAVQTEDPPPRSIVSAAVQVGTPMPILPHTSDSLVQTDPSTTQDAGTQTTPPPSPIPDPIPSLTMLPSSVPLKWADETASLPTKILPSPLPPRDLSDLRSSKSNPFSSLQRRSKNHSSRARQSRHPHSHFNFKFNSSYSLHHISFKPSRSHSYTKTYSHLNWESDPQLSDLSRSLKALGWIRAF